MQPEANCANCALSPAASSTADGRLCFDCLEDARFPDRPLCERCQRHKVTCSHRYFELGVRLCRRCSHAERDANKTAEYEPVLRIIREFTGHATDVLNTGGGCYVAYVHVGHPDQYGHGACVRCAAPIHRDPLGAWVDDTDGDACPGDETTAHADTTHQPDPHYPQVAITWDSVDTWLIAWETAPAESALIDTSDLPSAPDEHDRPRYGTALPTPEQVAERALLLIADPTLAEPATPP